MPCAESATRLQAYFDGEVDSMSAAEIERHIAQCVECRAELEALGEMRAALRSDLSYERTPPELRDRIVRALDRDGAVKTARPTERAASAWGSRSFWMGAGGGFACAAAAAGVAFLFLASPGAGPLLNDLVNAHVRSLMPAHLIDVESTDRHTVKPWFAGHADVSPVVADFADQGYRLVGGRADFFGHQRAAVVVYQHGAHIINVFSWSKDRGAPPDNTTRNGYHLAFWTSGNLQYCAVSDTGWDELFKLEALLRELNERDSRG